jgi:trimeric autotransporter adhesin
MSASLQISSVATAAANPPSASPVCAPVTSNAAFAQNLAAPSSASTAGAAATGRPPNGRPAKSSSAAPASSLSLSAVRGRAPVPTASFHAAYQLALGNIQTAPSQSATANLAPAGDDEEVESPASDAANSGQTALGASAPAVTLADASAVTSVASPAQVSAFASPNQPEAPPTAASGMMPAWTEAFAARPGGTQPSPVPAANSTNHAAEGAAGSRASNSTNSSDAQVAQGAELLLAAAVQAGITQAAAVQTMAISADDTTSTAAQTAAIAAAAIPAAVSTPVPASGIIAVDTGANARPSASLNLPVAEPQLTAAKTVVAPKSSAARSANAGDGTSGFSAMSATSPSAASENTPSAAFSAMNSNVRVTQVSLSAAATGETPAQAISDRAVTTPPAAAKENADPRSAADGTSQGSLAAPAPASQTNSGTDAFNGQSGSDTTERRGTDRSNTAASSTASGVSTIESALAADLSASVAPGAVGAVNAAASLANAATAGSSAQAATTSSLPASPPTSSTGNASGGTAASQPGSSDSIRAAELLARASTAEMHLSIRIEELGTVELRASLHQDSLTAAIGVARGDVQALLSSELAGLHGAMAEHSLQFSSFNVVKGSLGAWTGDPSGHQPGNQNPQRSRSGSNAFAATAREAISGEFGARISNADARVLESPGRLNVHA